MIFKYKIVKNVLSKNLCSKLVSKVDDLFLKQEKKLKKFKKHKYFHGELMNPFMYDKIFFNVLNSKKIINQLNIILGKNYQINMYALIKKKPGEVLRNDKMHIDGKKELLGIKKTIQLNIIISLTESNKFYGTTMLNLNKKKNYYSNLKPGDCLIYNSFLPHKGTFNYSNKSRYMIGINIIPHFIKSRFDYYNLTNKKVKNRNLKLLFGYYFRSPKNLKEFFSKRTYILK